MNQEAIQSALDAERCLQEAVILEYRRKAKLGQYVVISRDSQTCKIPAEEALRDAEAAFLKKYGKVFEG